MKTHRNLSQALLTVGLCGGLCGLAPFAHADNSENLGRYAKGVFAELQGDAQEARGHYEESLAADPDAYPLATKTSRLQTRTQDPAAAAATLRNYAQEHRQHLPSQLYYASYLKQVAPNDNFAQKAAIDTLELANENFPHLDVIYDPLILLYESTGRRADSLSLLEEQLKAPKEDPREWLALAPIIKTLYPKDDPGYAEKLALVYESASRGKLRDTGSARAVSEYYRSQGDLAEAIAVLQDHLELSPSSHSLRTRLGLLQLSNQEEAAGERSLLDVITIDPDQALAHSSLAKLYTKREEPLKALHHRAEALRITGGHPDEGIALAEEYLALDKPHEARLLLEKFRFDHPNSPAVHARLAIATLRDGLTEQAARLFRQAETLAEESPEDDAEKYLDADFQLEFANSLITAGDLDSAETRLRQAAQGLNLDTEPEKYARAVTSLAKLWLDQGKNEAPAKALLQRAIALDPENKEAQELFDGE